MLDAVLEESSSLSESFTALFRIKLDFGIFEWPRSNASCNTEHGKKILINHDTHLRYQSAAALAVSLLAADSFPISECFYHQI